MSLTGGRRLVRVRRAGDLISPAMRLLLSAAEPAAFVLSRGASSRRAHRCASWSRGRRARWRCHAIRSEGNELAGRSAACWPADGLSVEEEALEHLAAHLGSDRGLTRQELDKLALFIGDREDRTVRIADVAAVVDDSSALAVDDLLRAVLRGERDIEQPLDRLLAGSQRPEGLVRMTTGLLLQLLRCALAVEAGSTAARQRLRPGRRSIGGVARWSRRRSAAGAPPRSPKRLLGSVPPKPPRARAGHRRR